jgi:ATP-binding cassette subfamily B protein/subfamily B ATP-binding cassette protein MsbA
LIGNRLILFGSLCLLTIVMTLKLLPPLATKLAIDNVFLNRTLPRWTRVLPPFPEDKKTRLIALFVFVLVVAIVGVAIGLWSRWLATLVAKRVQLAISRKVFEHAASLPLNRVYSLRAGGAVSLLREDAGQVGELIFSLMFNPWRAVIQLLGGLVALLFIDWHLLLSAVIFVPAVYLSTLIWGRVIRPIFRDLRGRRVELDAKCTEVFSGMRVVRAFGRQHAEVVRFVRGNHLVLRLELLGWRWMRGVELLWEVALPVASGLLVLAGGIRVLDGYLSPGDLMMFLVFLTMLLEPMSVLANTMTQVQSGLASFDRVLELLEEPREFASHAKGIKIAKKSIAGRISLDRISFHYPESAAMVLDDVSLEIEPGELIALVGHSGSGKTTLCNLVARFYDPTEGTIRIDGRDLKTIDVASYRRSLGIVEQDVFLFEGTFAENIAYAQKRASRGDVERAARIANAAQFIEACPRGYDTLIGERGVHLSGGQRQRLAIARAVLADARILIMDEATSNLDSEAERLIQKSLESVFHNRTSLVIAHRLSTVRKSDRILVLEAGRVVEIGNHESLLARGGRYREMIDLQT